MPSLRVAVGERDHVRGAASAAVTLVEYGDFQCPFCGRAFPILRNLEQRFGRELRFVYRHFPLTEIHPLAMPAAEAAEAAGAQGRFWEMHELLFRHQPAFLPEQLAAYAAELSLDIETFKADLRSHRHVRHVREDFMSGVRSGVNRTPTLFINGARFDGDTDETLIARAIDAAREQAVHA